MITELWSRSLPKRIQRFLIEDTDSSGTRDVFLSTWGGKIYSLRGKEGKRNWVSEDFTYSPSSLNLLERWEKMYILSSFANKLRLFGTKKGKEAKETSLTSVALHVKVADLNQDGRQEIIVYTKDDTLYVLNDNLDVLWTKTVSLSPSPSSFLSCDINYDNKSELLVADHKRFQIFSHTGEEILVKEVTNKGSLLSLDVGHFTHGTEKETIIGFEGGISLFQGQNELAERELGYPFLITSGNLDGEGSEEIVVGDWKNDSVRVFKYEREKPSYKLSELYSLPLDGNPTAIATSDISGDGKEEILVNSEESKFKIFREGEQIASATSYPDTSNLLVGNLLGRGNGDIILQTGRETISVLTWVPRISAPSWVVKGRTFPVYTVVESGNDLSSSNSTIEILEKEYLGRKKLDVGYVSWYRYQCKPKKVGEGGVGLEGASFHPIYVASRRKIEENSHVWVTDEDFATLIENETIHHAQVLPEKIRYKVGRGGTGFFISSPVIGEIPLKIRFNSSSGETDLLKAWLHVEHGSGASLEIPDLILNQTTIMGTISNKATRRLRIRFRGNKTVDIEETPFTLQPTEKKEIELTLNVKMGDEKRKQVKDHIKCIYTGLDEHVLFLPINTLVINQDWTEEYLEEIGEKEGKERALTKMSMKLHISKERLKGLLAHQL